MLDDDSMFLHEKKNGGSNLYYLLQGRFFNAALEVKLPLLKSCGILTSPCLAFLRHKMGMIVLTTSQHCNDYIRECKEEFTIVSATL